VCNLKYTAEIKYYYAVKNVRMPLTSLDHSQPYGLPRTLTRIAQTIIFCNLVFEKEGRNYETCSRMRRVVVQQACSGMRRVAMHEACRGMRRVVMHVAYSGMRRVVMHVACSGMRPVVMHCLQTGKLHAVNVYEYSYIP
jgi:hypothetical protein